MNKKFFEGTLSDHTKGLVNEFQASKPSFLSAFYLTGGTGLSLHLGHRESEDLDFFCEEAFNPLVVEEELRKFGKLEQSELAKGTLNTFLNNVKLQFLEYPYALLEPFSLWDGIQISSVLDIACTKMQTVGMRGSKKDFIDIYFLLEKYTLEDLLKAVKKKYKEIDYSQTHILKSLIFFDEAEGQPMPRMHKQVTWTEIKTKIIQEVKKISFDVPQHPK